MTKHKILIKLLIDLIKTSKVDYNLTILGIQEYISLIIQVILLAVEDEDCWIKIAIYQNLVTVSSKNNTLQQNKSKHSKHK